MSAELRRLLSEATPGPWRWFDDNRASSPYLATVDRGRVYVMGFARRGMNSAQPLFQVRDDPEHPTWGVMQSAAEIGPEWTTHPDAALIVAAVNALPDLLAVIDAARRASDAMDEMHDSCERAGRCFDIAHSEARHHLRTALDNLDAGSPTP
jgi:hypothetical protein